MKIGEKIWRLDCKNIDVNEFEKWYYWIDFFYNSNISKKLIENWFYRIVRFESWFIIDYRILLFCFFSWDKEGY